MCHILLKNHAIHVATPSLILLLNRYNLDKTVEIYRVPQLHTRRFNRRNGSPGIRGYQFFPPVFVDFGVTENLIDYCFQVLLLLFGQPGVKFLRVSLGLGAFC
jgi:hypothetical protein